MASGYGSSGRSNWLGGGLNASFDDNLGYSRNQKVTPSLGHDAKAQRDKVFGRLFPGKIPRHVKDAFFSGELGMKELEKAQKDPQYANAVVEYVHAVGRGREGQLRNVPKVLNEDLSAICGRVAKGSERVRRKVARRLFIEGGSEAVKGYEAVEDQLYELAGERYSEMPFITDNSVIMISGDALGEFKKAYEDRSYAKMMAALVIRKDIEELHRPENASAVQELSDFLSIES